jgi:hypothetical protein
MEQLQFSLSTLNDVITQKLKSLASVTSAKDIKEINNFLQESQRLRKTIYSISDVEEYEEYEEEETSIEGPDGLDYLGILIQSCEYIKNFHTIVDFKKVKEAKAQWLLDESAEFLSELRKSFGNRLPVIPGSIEGRSEEIDIKEPVECAVPKKRK